MKAMSDEHVQALLLRLDISKAVAWHARQLYRAMLVEALKVASVNTTVFEYRQICTDVAMAALEAARVWGVVEAIGLPLRPELVRTVEAFLGGSDALVENDGSAVAPGSRLRDDSDLEDPDDPN